MRVADEFNLDEIGEAAFNELHDRLKDPVERKKLPATGLLQVTSKWLDIKSKEPPEIKEAEPTVLELVETPGLPVQKKLELLMDEARRTREYLDLVERTLGELGGD